jgi:hypothetical protein
VPARGVTIRAGAAHEARARDLARLLQAAHGAAVSVERGNDSELTVWVGEERVATRGWLGFPKDADVVSRVGEKLPPR